MVESIIPVVSALAAIIAALVTCYLYIITKRNLVYQILANLQMEYRSPEMLYAISTLWEFYRDECGKNEEKLIEKYEEIHRKDREKLLKVKDEYDRQTQMHGDPREKPTEFVKTTLHHQRRLVHMFYWHLATLTTNRIIPKKIVYELWPEEALKIIPLIIIPMDKKLAEMTDTKPPDKSSKLYQLYLDSKDYE